MLEAGRWRRCISGNQTAEACAVFALDRYEDKAVLHVTRGRTRYLAGDADGARASFDAALALDAHNREATLLKALLLEREARSPRGWIC